MLEKLCKIALRNGARGTSNNQERWTFSRRTDSNSTKCLHVSLASNNHQLVASRQVLAEQREAVPECEGVMRRIRTSHLLPAHMFERMHKKRPDNLPDFVDQLRQPHLWDSPPRDTMQRLLNTRCLKRIALNSASNRFHVAFGLRSRSIAREIRRDTCLAKTRRR